jgi:hypothetical protein
LNHPAIATLYSFFRQGDQFFVATEFVPGKTLEQKLAREALCGGSRVERVDKR